MGSLQAQLTERLSGVVFLGIGLKLWPFELFELLSGERLTFTERHFTVSSLGSSAYIKYPQK